jgi:hypothetical protein
VLTAVDPAALDAAIGGWVRSRLAAIRKAKHRVVLAIDGKTLRGARPPGGTAPNLIACLDHATGTVLAQVAVDGKTNEITMLASLLDQIPDLKDALISMDAIHAQRGHAAYLHKRGAHYLVTVKGNQPDCSPGSAACPGRTSRRATPPKDAHTAGPRSAPVRHVVIMARGSLDALREEVHAGLPQS